jgi:hypothetical protein
MDDGRTMYLCYRKTKVPCGRVGRFVAFLRQYYENAGALDS